MSGPSDLRALSAMELIALILAEGPEPTERDRVVAARLIARRDLKRLTETSRTELAELLGSGSASVQKFLIVLELARRIELSGHGELGVIASARDAFNRLKWMQNEKKEHVVALYLDAKGHIIAERVVHVGTATMSIVGPREVFREGIREGAASVIIAHNHPSGDPEPSPQDLTLTENLVVLGDKLDLPVLDHVIIGHHGYVSLKERGDI